MRIMIGRRDVRCDIGPGTCGWRASILSEVLYFGRNEGYRV
jgi:hypothetical protein